MPVQPAQPDIDHSLWDATLKLYVTPEARVDYRSLKQHGLPQLDAYLARLAAPWPSAMPPGARKAALINAYNALTVRWIVAHYPVGSIRQTGNPFEAVRHTVDGRAVSLDQIETELRRMGDPRVHAVLVCAARDCPPLRREAYAPARLDRQLDGNTRAWLANSRLNAFFPERRLARLSPIFKWYASDFASAGGLVPFLARHAPAGRAEFLLAPGAGIEYLDYDWTLNDSAAPGPRFPLLPAAASVLACLLLALVWFVRRRRALRIAAGSSASPSCSPRG
ncbi:MAG: DUF547 domain-containing protein [Candidatus Solibacter usitatus]|nr:DUF547 domain-containing protein [Candidatus Solibacter usitatus]